MSVALLLEMAVSDSDRVGVVTDDERLTVGELNTLADGGAGVIATSGAGSVVYVGLGGAMLPLLIFASARAARAFTPLNYRLSGEALAELIERLPDPLIVFDAEYADVVAGLGAMRLESQEFLAAAATAEPAAEFPDPEDVAVVLFTSGTTSRPKAVELTHNNLTSYITSTVEFASAEPGDAALICVPPYHIAGVSAALSNLYAGRKMVYLRKFDPQTWIRLASAEAVTSATVVPTMLDRIVTELETNPTPLPALRTLAYGGSKVALPLVRKALGLLPEVGFVNAYGLTETSSTIAVLTPDDHRQAHQADDELPAGGSARSDSRYRVSRSRSAPTMARSSDPRRSASYSSAATRYRAATPRSARCWMPKAGSRPRTVLPRCRRISVHRWRRPMTRSSAAARTSRPPRSRMCWSNTHMCEMSPSSASRTTNGARSWSPSSSCRWRQPRPVPVPPLTILQTPVPMVGVLPPRGRLTSVPHRFCVEPAVAVVGVA